MPRAVYFDVSSLLALLEGDGAVLKIIEDSVDFYTGSLQMAELLGAGALKKKKNAKLRLLLNNLNILDFSKDDAIHVAELIKKVKESGMDYSFEALVSLAQTKHHGLTPVTKNTEFAKIKDDGFHIEII